MPRPLLAKLSRPSPSQVLARQEFVAPPPEQPAIKFPALSAPQAIQAKYHFPEWPSRACPDKTSCSSPPRSIPPSQNRMPESEKSDRAFRETAPVRSRQR